MLDTLRKIVAEKNKIDPGNSGYEGSITYLNGLKDEVEEVKAEMKENNSVYLEDELGDILWDYLNLLDRLTDEGKISGVEQILKRAEKKYGERIEAIKNSKNTDKTFPWKEIKEKQKAELEKEHKKMYC